MAGENTETTVVADDAADFDAAFAEAIAAPAAAPADDKAKADDKAMGTEEPVVDAAAQKVIDDAAAAQKVIDDKKVADDAATAAAVTKVAEDKAAADKKVADDAAAVKTEETRRAALTDEQRATEDAAAKKVADDAAAAKKVIDDKKVADDAVAAKAAADKKVADDAAAAKAREEAEKAAEIKDPELSAEDKALLAEFEKEWPDHAAATKRATEHAVAMVEAKFSRTLVKLVNKIYEDMAPLARTASTVEASSFRQFVVGKHADYDVIAPQLEPWIAKQPAYLADAYKRVYSEGNAEELCDLVQRFKDANGVKPQVLPTTPAVTEPPAAAPKPKPSAAAAAALAPVTDKRTTPTPSGQDSNDFDGAFAEAAAQYEKPAK